METINFVQLSQFKVQKTKVQKYVAAFYKVVQLEDLDK